MVRRIAAALGATATVLLVSVCASTARADDPTEPPRIDPARPIHCLTDGDNRRWRVQCNDPGDPASKARICVYAPDSEVDEDGVWTRGLERVARCQEEGRFDQAKLRADGYTLVPGVADAPRGWLRDRRGRVFQVTFDLHKRLYVGVAWMPDGESTSRTALDFELLEWEHTGGPTRIGTFRHRVHLMEGNVQLAPFGADLVALHYDLSRRWPAPLLRITTFFGKPRRYDVDAHLGLFLEAGRLRIDEVDEDRQETLLTYGTAHLTWDVWRNRDMSSFVRLRGGASLEETFTEEDDGRPDRTAFTPAAAIDGNLTLDDAGYHHLVVLAEYEQPRFFDEEMVGKSHGQRFKGSAGYERILVALNDQPLTLRVAGEARWRDDVPGVEGQWDLRATAGLRFSLWAPAR